MRKAKLFLKLKVHSPHSLKLFGVVGVLSRMIRETNSQHKPQQSLPTALLECKTLAAFLIHTNKTVQTLESSSIACTVTHI